MTAATLHELRGWFDAAPEGATHMIVVCDEFSWEDHPVYVFPGEDVRQREKEERGKPLATVMEVYLLAYSFYKQAALKRAFIYELPLDGHDDRVLELLHQVPIDALGRGVAEGAPFVAALFRAELDRRHAYDRVARDKQLAEIQNREGRRASVIDAEGHECCRCQRRGRVGVTDVNAGMPIEWRCSKCGQYVCIDCTLTIPGSEPPEFYEDTYCSEACRDGVEVVETEAG